jgi:nitrous oxidase accessory protein NosD
VHDIDATNTVSAGPIRYVVGASNVVLSPATDPAGFVGIVNGNNVRVTGYAFWGNIVGGLVAGGADVRFDNITATLNEAAVLLSHTTRATVADSSFEWNKIGAWLERATRSRLTHDWFGNQSRGCCLAIGVLLHYRADDNRIDNNTFYKNEDALDVLGFAGAGCPIRTKVRDNNFVMNGVAIFEEFEWVFCLPNTVDAIHNYWGAANGPSSAEGYPVPGGDGDGVTDDVLWTPFHGSPVPGARPRP